MKPKGRLLRKTIVWLLLSIMLPSLLLAAFLCVNTARNTINEQIEECNVLLNLMAEGIQSNAEMVENALEVLSYDSNVLKLLSDKPQSQYSRLITQLYGVQSVLSQMTIFLHPLDARLILFARNDEVPESYWSVLSLSTAQEMEDYRLFDASGAQSLWVGRAWIYPSSTVSRSSDNQEMLCYYRNIYSGVDQVAGALKCGVPFQRMFSIVDARAFNGDVFVMREGQALYSSLGAAPLADGVEEAVPFQHVDGHFYVAKAIEPLGISLLLRLEGREVYWQAALVSLPQMIMALLSGALLVLVTRAFLRSIQRRLDQAVLLVRDAQSGNLDVAFPAPDEDEIGELIQSFNVLLLQLRQTAEEKIAHEKEKKRILRLMLQYQVNPHFLFNTLNWLQMSVEMQMDSDQLSDAIMLLGKLLRYNLEGEAMATLSGEVECMENYVRLMNMRRHEMVALATDLVGLAPEMPVMRFLLQPICENAIQHGMLPGKTLHIRLHGYMAGDEVLFSLENDGREIPPDSLAALNDRLMTAQDTQGIGLANIRRRLALVYGADAGIFLTSSPRKTTVTLHYPINR